MYIILEIQTSNGTSAVVTPIQTAEAKYDAMSIYHNILAFAATSSVNCHTAVVLDEQGRVVARESYFHESTNNGEE